MIITSTKIIFNLYPIVLLGPSVDLRAGLDRPRQARVQRRYRAHPSALPAQVVNLLCLIIFEQWFDAIILQYLLRKEDEASTMTVLF